MSFKHITYYKPSGKRVCVSVVSLCISKSYEYSYYVTEYLFIQSHENHEVISLFSGTY